MKDSRPSGGARPQRADRSFLGGFLTAYLLRSMMPQTFAVMDRLASQVVLANGEVRPAPPPVTHCPACGDTKGPVTVQPCRSCLKEAKNG